MDLVRLQNGQIVRFGGSTKSVGRFISTKAVGSDERHDITHQYKYPEGTHTLQTLVHVSTILINTDSRWFTCDSGGLKAQRRSGKCTRRPNIATSYRSEERSLDSIWRCLLLLWRKSASNDNYWDAINNNNGKCTARKRNVLYILLRNVVVKTIKLSQTSTGITSCKCFERNIWFVSLLFPKIKLADSMIVGWDFEVFAVLTNNCMEARACSFSFFARTVSYNGKLGDDCGFISEKVEVPPGEGQ